MIDKNNIQQLRELGIETVATRLGISVSRHKSLCPFHDDTVPSLTYYRAKNTYRCFVCDAHGGPIDLVMNKLRLPFPDACRWLADESNIIIEEERKNPPPKQGDKRGSAFDASRYTRYFEHPFINDIARRFLYDDRHLDPRVIHWCRLNSFRDKKGINWLQIPYFDIDGNLIGVQSRNLDYGKQLGTLKPETWNPRFRFPKSSTCHIYNLPVLKLLRPNEPLFITEGASDCWAMLSSGHKAIAIPSATLLKPDDLDPIKDCIDKLDITLHMYPDQDAPGCKLYYDLDSIFKSSPIKGGKRGVCYHQLPEGFKDFSDYYVNQKLRNI